LSQDAGAPAASTARDGPWAPGPPPGPPSPPLLGSKLVAPDPPAGLVLRPRLFELLGAGLDGEVTLLGAPAGYGKTVLVRSWAEAAGHRGPIGWLSLEPDDNEPGRFWAYLVAALQHAGALPPGAASPAATRRAGAIDLAPLLNRLASVQAPVVLVLDDFHEIVDAAVLRGMEFLLRHAPPSLRLVIAARADPRLPLHKLRTSGKLTEIRSAELAFTIEEAAELLAHEGLALPDEDVAALLGHTEGWVAGLRLAALSLRDHPDPHRFVAEFAGDDRSVADYLTGEVLTRQPEAVRAMLLRTSILDRFDGALADALTGRDDGEPTLAELERSNAFLVPLEPRRSWYRYHQLFAELLRVELRHQAPEQVPELHRRAAVWHAANGLPAGAARHALAAGDWQLATTVVLEHWHELVLGDPSILRDLLGLLPPELAEADPELALMAAADRAGGGQTGEARVADVQRRRLPLLVAALRLSEAWRAGDLDGVAVAALEMLALLGPGSATATASTATAPTTTSAATAGAAGPPHAATVHDHAARVFALVALAAAERHTGDLDAADASLREGLAVAGRAGLERQMVECTARLALLEADRGRLRAAERTALEAIELAERRGWTGEVQTAAAHLALAVADGQRADLAAAGAQLDLATSAWGGDAAGGGAPAVVAELAAVRAWLLQAGGDPGGGLAALEAARQELSAWRPLPYLERPLAVAEAEVLLTAGDTAAARTAIDRAAGPGPPLPAALLARARLELDDGEPRSAIATLAPLLNGSAGVSSLRLLLEAWLLDGLAARALDDRERAFRSTERALTLAEREGFRLALRSPGAPMRELLAGQLERHTSHDQLVAELLDAREKAPEAAGRRHGGREQALIEPLSERERVVLRYLTSALSNVEIAAELYVSVNTVKTHIKSIYRKLETTGRRDAVRRARELRLL
jgi:LuxR family maltose regulon positive regulatory protein